MAALPLAKISERLPDGFLNQLEENVNPMKSVKTEVKYISEKLTTIGGLMSDAERRKLKEEEVRIWLQKLDELWVQHHIASRIKAIYDELEVIWNEAALFKFVKSHLATCEKPGSNLCDELEAFGRESDRDVIVGRLVSESSNKRDVGVLVISVVGTGGIGKTNLARIVFNDDMVKTHFRTSRNGSTLSRKKFLLILDSVCIQDEIKWLKIRDSLKDGVSGSGILVITRSERAQLMGTTYMHHLKQMPDSDCWEILSRRAFQGRSKEIFGKVEQIGKGVAKKCNGSPRAAKLVGSLLQSWFKVVVVVAVAIWELEEVSVDVELFPALYLTYHELSPELKCCIRYCAVFQKNLKIDVEGLIRLWMAQSYILNSSEANEIQMEERGREYFTLLYEFPQGLEKMTWLRTLTNVKIGTVYFNWSSLKNLNQLQEFMHIQIFDMVGTANAKLEERSTSKI
ncbi:putative disease resistance protein RGA3 [Coffea arabica]|uniref:Disease resistance protein RGA3 n=1 Tax=Coffea arabica TaxID=13443 RepID=A0A6P6SAL6_COFAR|nr:putative disease resistance protein RGA3 [Coffea arabica]